MWKPRKDKGWCDANGVEHSWADVPRTASDDSHKRWCVNCGHSQRLDPPPTMVVSRWIDEPTANEWTEPLAFQRAQTQKPRVSLWQKWFS